MQVKAAHFLAILLGACAACVATSAALLLLFPGQAETLKWRLGLHPPVVQCATFLDGATRPDACSSASTELVVTTDWSLRPLAEPLIEKELGSRQKTAFARYRGGGYETRSVFLVRAGELWRVDARFDTDYGSYVGTVREGLSGVHEHETGLCFDLIVERHDGSGDVERWQGRIDWN